MRLGSMQYGTGSWFSVSDMWVFDDIVVIRIAQTQEIRFYEKAMVAGLTRDPLSVTVETENIASGIENYNMA